MDHARRGDGSETKSPTVLGWSGPRQAVTQSGDSPEVADWVNGHPWEGMIAVEATARLRYARGLRRKVSPQAAEQK